VPADVGVELRAGGGAGDDLRRRPGHGSTSEDQPLLSHADDEPMCPTVVERELPANWTLTLLKSTPLPHEAEIYPRTNS
jgi:hypothetical protein